MAFTQSDEGRDKSEVFADVLFADPPDGNLAARGNCDDRMEGRSAGEHPALENWVARLGIAKDT